jgi:hypothetical protein
MFPKLHFFKEPLIEFRHGQKMEDPHDGLSLFGPYDADEPYHPRNITYGVIGTQNGMSLFEEWAKTMSGPIIPDDMNKKLWPPFPGFDVAFYCVWPDKAAWTLELDEKELIRSSHKKDPYARAFSIVTSYISGFEVLKKRDESFNVIICVVPDEVYKNCRPKSRPDEVWGEKPKPSTIREFKKGQKTIEDWLFPKDSVRTTEKYGMSVDFRRQIKARALKYNIPIQIIRESTLFLKTTDDDRRSLTCLSDRAWNLSTALYYKSGGKPWRLASARENVCYIGISFKRTETGKDGRTACCAAQMFLDSGDGVVFLGDEGPWYSPEDKQYHLTRVAAENLLTGILETYYDLEGKELKELFLHSRSVIGDDEFEGYESACPADVKIVGVNVRRVRNDVKLYRPGRMPVLRGTFLEWDENTGYLWGTGFKPRLETYDGWEVPIPLKIQVQYGEVPIEQVASDIFGYSYKIEF